MLRAASGAGIPLCSLPELIRLMPLTLLFVIPSSFQSFTVSSAIERHYCVCGHFLIENFLSAVLPPPPSHTPPPVHDQTEMGKKRASPGADTEKNPLGDVDLSDVHHEKLDKISDESSRVDIALGMRRPPPKRIVLVLI